MISQFKGPDKDKALTVLVKTSLKQYKFDIAEKQINSISTGSIKKEIKQLYGKVQEWKNEHEEIKNLGGLHILGTERHESRRIDNQLRGRAGRQGDIGSSRFFISLEDDLMRLFGSERISNVMQRLGLQEGENIEHPWISKAIENAQKKVESRNFDIRKHLLEYDNVMNQQREFTYDKRNNILNEGDLKKEMTDSVKDVIEYKMEQIFGKKTHADNWDMESFNNFLSSSFGTKINPREIDLKSQTFNDFAKLSSGHLIEKYNTREKKFTPQLMRQLERAIMLEVLDNKWKAHLYSMDHLKEGIGWRAYGERDPLVEYKFEGFRLFENLVDQIKLEALEILFKVQPVGIADQIRMITPEEESTFYGKTEHSEYGQFDTIKLGQEEEAAQSQGPPEFPGQPQPPSEQAAAVQVRRDQKKVGRNEPCYCGSGKKYKYCHGQN